MSVTGIICEYNPLHLGHQKQIDHLHSLGHSVVCVMSGNFVQRGHPAIVDKMARAKAAVECGTDLVLELPMTAALSSAEGFAAVGVTVLSRLCDRLCFGAETADAQQLMDTAQALLSPEFSPALRQELDKGLSFPAARQAALEHMGFDGELLESPNNILAVEYCKAILAQNADMEILPILRQGDYHDAAADPENPSATAVRQLMVAGENFAPFIPKNAQPAVANAAIHTLQAGEKAILYRLRTMTDAEFEALPYGSEGLWRKFMHACRSENTLEQIIAATKSKRYTRTRIDRMVMCAFLRITSQDLISPIPYCRALAFNDAGRAILKQANKDGFFVNIGTDTKHPYQEMERRATALYGLFADTAQAPDMEENYRVYYKRGE